MSPTILFSGATPEKVLRMLNHIKVAWITDRTFYYHQKQYLQPEVVSVWGTKQSALLAHCSAAETLLTIDGDGRADSPGHSAKYRLHEIIDLTINKITDMQLVQLTPV